MAPRRIAITGATGFLGKLVVSQLIKLGYDVTALCRAPGRLHRAAAPYVRVVQGDMRDTHALRTLCSGADTIIHLAGLMGIKSGSRAEFVRDNASAAAAVAEAAISMGCKRMVFASTLWVAGRTGHYADDAPAIMSGDKYIDSKVHAEKRLTAIAKRANLDLVICRLGSIYGPESPAWTELPLYLMRRHLMILPMGGRGLLQPLFGDDAADWITAAVDHGESGIYSLADPDPISVKDFFAYYARMLGVSFIPSIPAPIARVAAMGIEAVSSSMGIRPLFTPSAVVGTTIAATFEVQKSLSKLNVAQKVPLEEGMARIRAWLPTVRTI